MDILTFYSHTLTIDNKMILIYLCSERLNRFCRFSKADFQDGCSAAVTERYDCLIAVSEGLIEYELLFLSMELYGLELNCCKIAGSIPSVSNMLGRFSATDECCEC